jgi:hypothetical protein
LGVDGGAADLAGADLLTVADLPGGDDLAGADLASEPDLASPDLLDPVRTPGAKQCSGGQLMTCRGDGSGFDGPNAPTAVSPAAPPPIAPCSTRQAW